MEAKEIIGPDPKPLDEFPVKVSLEDLKIMQAVWGDEAMHNMVTDVCLRLGKCIIDAVNKLDFDATEFVELAKENNLLDLGDIE